MGMSTHVIGFIPPDEKWKQMKAVYDACEAADLPIPDEVDDFFNGDAPDDAGVEIALPVEAWENESECSGFELQVKDIPEHVTTIRFYNSW